MIEDLNQGGFVVASDGNSLAFKPMDVVQLEVELSWKREVSVEEEDESERGEEGKQNA